MTDPRLPAVTPEPPLPATVEPAPPPGPPDLAAPARPAPRRSFRNLIYWLLVGALAAGALSFFAAPWYAFAALRQAARADDIGAIEKLMDVGAVRASLRAQASPDGPAPKAGLLQDPLGAIGALAQRRGGSDVDPLLTPAALAHYTHAQDPSPGAPFRFGDLIPGLHGVEMRHWGPNQVRFAVLAPGPGDQESLFTFDRRGWFEWRLTHIRRPAPVER